MKNDPIARLVGELTKLPGIGERTALRLTLHLLSQNRPLLLELSQALQTVHEQVRECPRCFSLTCEKELCSLCASHSRDNSLLCVVATLQDQMAIEATGEFRGLYHILHGTLAPMEGIGPKELRIAQLLERFQTSVEAIKEVIIATPPTVEGEATALYLGEQLQPFGAQLTRIASGVPVGGDLQFADRVTLARAMMQRRRF